MNVDMIWHTERKITSHISYFICNIKWKIALFTHVRIFFGEKKLFVVLYRCRCRCIAFRDSEHIFCMCVCVIQNISVCGMYYSIYISVVTSYSQHEKQLECQIELFHYEYERGWANTDIHLHTYKEDFLFGHDSTFSEIWFGLR